jgi:hypothetical protein
MMERKTQKKARITKAVLEEGAGGEADQLEVKTTWPGRRSRSRPAGKEKGKREWENKTTKRWRQIKTSGGSRRSMDVMLLLVGGPGQRGQGSVREAAGVFCVLALFYQCLSPAGCSSTWNAAPEPKSTQLGRRVR